MAFDNTQGQIDAGRKALLEAVARAGSAGKEAYDRANASVNTAQQQAASQALQQSQISNMAPNSSRSDSVAALYKSNLAAGQARFGDDLARRQMATEDYLTKLGAATPIIQKRMDESRDQSRQELETDLALRQSDADAALAQQKQAYEAKQAEAAADKAWEMEKREWERADRQAKAAEAAAKASKEGSVAGMPYSQQQDFLLGSARGAKQGANEFSSFPGLIADTGNIMAGFKNGVHNTVAPSDQVVARGIGQYMGLDPNVVGGMPKLNPKAIPIAPPAAAKAAKLSAQDVSTVEKDPDYVKINSKIGELVAAGTTIEEFEEALRATLFGNGKNKTRSYAYLMAQYANMFPSITETKRLSDYQEGE